MAEDNEWAKQYPPSMNQKELDRIIAAQNTTASKEEAQRTHEKQERIKWLKAVLPNSTMYRDEHGRAWVETRRPANLPGLTLEGLMAAACSTVLGPEFIFVMKSGAGDGQAYIHPVPSEQ